MNGFYCGCNANTHPACILLIYWTELCICEEQCQHRSCCTWAHHRPGNWDVLEQHSQKLAHHYCCSIRTWSRHFWDTMLHALPSGAAVERMFSCAGQILVPRQCQVSSKLFWYRYVWWCLIDRSSLESNYCLQSMSQSNMSVSTIYCCTCTVIL